VKVAHFVFRCCGSMYVFCFCGAGSFFVYVKMIVMSSVFIMFTYFSLVSLDIGYVFTLFNK
jgi:hypothetical protein